VHIKWRQTLSRMPQLRLLSSCTAFHVSIENRTFVFRVSGCTTSVALSLLHQRACIAETPVGEGPGIHGPDCRIKTECFRFLSKTCVVTSLSTAPDRGGPGFRWPSSRRTSSIVPGGLFGMRYEYCSIAKASPWHIYFA
jgi:hypothetical protein